MKKTISILLAVVIMLSLSVFAFAAEQTVELGKEYTVTVNEEILTYTFAVPKSGLFKLSAKLSSSENFTSASVYVSDDDNIFASANLFNFADDDISFGFLSTESSDYFVAKSGEMLSVEISKDADWDSDEVEPTAATISFSITEATDCRELNIGSSYSVSSEGEYFVIRPNKDTIFNVWSNDDGYVSVMGTDGSYMSSNYYYESISLDFSFEVKSGEIYGVYVSPDFYSDDDDEYEAYSMILNVADGSTITPDFIELNDIVAVKGDITCADLYVFPFGSNCNFDDLTFELADDEIATIEYDKNNNTLWVTGNKIGKTTLTVTEPISGVSTTVELEVVSNATMRFREILDTIISFFIAVKDFFVNLINLF